MGGPEKCHWEDKLLTVTSMILHIGHCIDLITPNSAAWWLCGWGHLSWHRQADGIFPNMQMSMFWKEFYL